MLQAYIKIEKDEMHKCEELNSNKLGWSLGYEEKNKRIFI